MAPASRTAELEPQHRDDGDQRVAQAVVVHDAALRDSARPGGQDVVALQDVQHVGAREAHEDPREHDAEGDGRQHEVPQRRRRTRRSRRRQRVDDVEAGKPEAPGQVRGRRCGPRWETICSNTPKTSCSSRPIQKTGMQ